MAIREDFALETPVRLTLHLIHFDLHLNSLCLFDFVLNSLTSIHFDFTLNSLWFHSDFTLSSLRIHFDFTLLSLWVHFDLTLNSLWFHFDSLGFYFDIIFISLWYHSLSQGFHIEFNLISLWIHFDFTLLSLWIHFEFTLDFAKSSLWLHFRSQRKRDRPWQRREKGKPPGHKGKREQVERSRFGLVPTMQWTPRVRTHERNETISRSRGEGPGSPHSPQPPIIPLWCL